MTTWRKARKPASNRFQMPAIAKRLPLQNRGTIKPTPLPPTSSTDARQRFHQRTGVEPFADKIVGTAIAIGAAGEVLQTTLAVDRWIEPLGQTLATIGAIPEVALWARYSLSCIGPTPSLAINTATESIDVVKLVDDLAAQVAELQENGERLRRAVSAITEAQAVGAEPHRFIDPPTVGRPIELGRAKFAKRLAGAWQAAGRGRLEAEDFALLAVAVGMEDVPATSAPNAQSGSTPWQMMIERWRSYIRANPPTLVP